MTASLGGLLPVAAARAGADRRRGRSLLAARRGPRRVILAAPLVVLALVWALPDGPRPASIGSATSSSRSAPTASSRLFGTVFSIMAFAGGLFALRQERLAEIPVAFMYAGAALGVVFAGDLITVFVFWEVMAVCSTLVIWMAGRGRARRRPALHRHPPPRRRAADGRHRRPCRRNRLDRLRGDARQFARQLADPGRVSCSTPAAGRFPPGCPTPIRRHPGRARSSSPPSPPRPRFWCCLRGFPGEEVLIWIGLIMVFYGIIYAILENDMRRILAYSIINQVGFMVTGIGIGTDMALNGAAAHAFVHIIYKALLLMSAGSVMFMTGRTKCTELGGLFRTMPITTICGIIGALSISAFPLTSGFVAKSMISDGAARDHLTIVWFLLTAASAGVFLHAGIKFPWFVFFQKDSGLRPPDPPWTMRSAMILLSFLCIGIGVFPAPLYAILPFPVDFVPYTGSHVVSQLQLLLFSGLAFFLLLGWLKRTETITLDVDWLWRRLGPALIAALDGGSGRAADALLDRGRGRPHAGAADRLSPPWPDRSACARPGRPAAWPSGPFCCWRLFDALLLLIRFRRFRQPMHSCAAAARGRLPRGCRLVRFSSLRPVCPCNIAAPRLGQGLNSRI